MTDETSEEDVSLVRRVPWRRVLGVGSTLLLVAVVALFVAYAAPQVVGAEDSYVVLSGSMEPTMSPGDVILVSQVSASQVGRGDVITFAEAGDQRPTTHRVVEVVDRGGDRAFRTQGDNNENPDQSLVSPSEVEGKVMSVAGYLVVIPLVGYVIQFASTPLGLVALLVAPLGILALSEVWSVVSDAATSPDPDESGDGGDGEVKDTDSVADAAESAAETGAGSEATTTAVSGEDADDQAATDGEADGPESEDTADDEEEAGGVTFTAAELQLGLAVLLAFLAYSLWVAYATLAVWAFAVAASVLATFLLLGGLYVVGGESGNESDADEDGDDTTAERTDQSSGTDEKATGGKDTGDTPTVTGQDTSAGSDSGPIGSQTEPAGFERSPPRADSAVDLPIADGERTETEVGDDD